MRPLTTLGFWPAHPWSLYAPLAAAALWLLFLPFAHFKRIGMFYRRSLWAAAWEEVVFRGLAYGVILYVWHSALLAIAGSSLVFGLAHMRNVWWAGWRRSLRMTAYTGFIAGPLFAAVRWASGDIYLGVLVHFVHNLLVMFPWPGTGHRVAATPTDAELREAAGR